MAQVYGAAIADCPNCDTPIGDQHPYTWCSKCGQPLPSDILSKLPVSPEQRESAASRALAPLGSPFAALSAYADTVAAIGWIVIAIGSIAFIYGIFGVSGNLLVRLVTAAPSLIVGILGLGLVASGQLMKCFVAIQRDTAFIAQSMRDAKNAG